MWITPKWSKHPILAWSLGQTRRKLTCWAPLVTYAWRRKTRRLRKYSEVSICLPFVRNEATALIPCRYGRVNILLCHLESVPQGSLSMSISSIIPILLDMRFAIYTGSIYRTDIHFSKAKEKTIYKQAERQWWSSSVDATPHWFILYVRARLWASKSAATYNKQGIVGWWRLYIAEQKYFSCWNPGQDTSSRLTTYAHVFWFQDM